MEMPLVNEHEDGKCEIVHLEENLVNGVLRKPSFVDSRRFMAVGMQV